MRHLMLLAICGGFALCIGACTATNRQQAEMDERALELLRLIQQEEWRSIVDRYHFPPEYTENELMEDKEGCIEALQLLAEEFGRVDSVEHVDGYIAYETGVYGGTLDFWEQLAPRLHFAFYKVHYENVGRGVLKLRFFDDGKSLGLQGLNFGIEASTPGARATVLKVMKANVVNSAKRHGTELPPNLDEMLEANVPVLEDETAR